MAHDPFHNGHETGVVHVHTCYVCDKVHGCLKLVSKRLVVFQDTCDECDRKDKPDCHARSTAKLSEMPVICDECAENTS